MEGGGDAVNVHKEHCLEPSLDCERGLCVGFVGKDPRAEDAGGGEVQMAKTAEALRRLGVEIRFLTKRREMPDVDLLHLFGSRPEWLDWVEQAKRFRVPAAVSTIAWFDPASYWSDAPTLPRKVAAMGRFAARLAFPRLPSWRRRLYHAADRLLPNSHAEARQLTRLFQVRKHAIRVVPNAADLRFAEAVREPFVERFGISGFVLCPGRIEPRKNQLTLIRALGEASVPLVILGRAVPGHETYAARCRREARDVTFIDTLQHEDPCLASAYAACGCLALVSRFETPGLVALEAALCGTPLVLTEGGATREYFGEFARYVNPSGLGEIRRAVVRAAASPRNPALADHVRMRYTWEETAQATLAVYRELLGSFTWKSRAA